MDQDQVWQAIDSQRTTVARLLESLHDSDWGARRSAPTGPSAM
jgi:hypothetical protein